MKTFKTMVLIVVIFLSCSVQAFAAEEDGIFEYEEKYYQILTDELSEDTQKILEESGIDDIDFESIVSSQPRDIINFFKNSAMGTVDGPIKNFITNCLVIVVVSIVSSYLSDNEKKKKSVNLIIYAYIAISVCVPVAPVITAGAAAISMSSKFMLAFLPILAGIIAAARNPILALNYNSLTLYLAQGISAFSSNILLPFEGMLFALVSVNIVSDTMNVKKLASSIKSTVTKTLSILASVFVSVLTIKGILSNIADTVTSRGAKLLVSSIVPVIGGSMGEAYATVVNSLLLVKSSVGIFGIVSIAAINLPVIIELLCWSLSLSFSGVLADVFGLNTIGDYYREVSDIVKTFNVILIFTCVLFIISTGILLTLRNSV
ncbi:MAG: hypothetical protein E7536_01960 [Ruminococcaceae bacterium]|nr:hypothetical protein [Oscillospiraceae bacterium]